MKIGLAGDFFVNPGSTSTLNGVMPVLNDCTHKVVNLEAPITGSTGKIVKSGPHLRMQEESLKQLTNAGFDHVCLANNHIMDYGSMGLSDTIGALQKNDIGYVGAGKNQSEKERWITWKDADLRVAVLNWCENEWSTSSGNEPGANAIDPVSNCMAIKAAKQEVDRVIVVAHGGHEHFTYPSPRMKALFRFYIEAGADVVINHHTHCVSGWEMFKGCPIFYSLGNFYFPNSKADPQSEWNHGLLVKLELTKETIGFELVHTHIKPNSVDVLDGKRRDERNAYLEQLNRVIADDSALQAVFDGWVNRQRRLFRNYIEPNSGRVLTALRNRGLFPSLWSKRKMVYLNNLVRCEAHRDILLEVLKDEISHS